MKYEERHMGEAWQAAQSYALSLPETLADHPFDEDFETTVVRHAKSRKWFCLFMRVSARKIGREGSEPVELLNLKCAPEDGIVARELFDGILPAYHMNKTHWITVVLDGSVPQAFVNRLIAKSYLLTKGRKT